MGEIEKAFDRAEAEAEIERLREEVARLRRQNKEAADRRQRECAPIHARHDRLANLMRQAMELHNREMGPERRGLFISNYGQATAAAILGENQRLKLALHEIANIEYSAHPADDILAVVEIAVKALR